VSSGKGGGESHRLCVSVVQRGRLKPIEEKDHSSRIGCLVKDWERDKDRQDGDLKRKEKAAFRIKRKDRCAGKKKNKKNVKRGGGGI